MIAGAGYREDRAIPKLAKYVKDLKIDADPHDAGPRARGRGINPTRGDKEDGVSFGGSFRFAATNRFLAAARAGIAVCFQVISAAGRPRFRRLVADKRDHGLRRSPYTRSEGRLLWWVARAGG